MPLRNDQTAWWNLPGCLVAYQSVAAPGPNLARYNMRAGGENRYAATDSGVGATIPVWDVTKGWVCAAGRYLRTGISAQYGYTLLVRYLNVVGGGAVAGLYKYSVPNGGFAIFPNVNSKIYYYGAAELAVSPQLTSGVVGIAGPTAYRNGVYDGTIAAGTFPAFNDLYINGVFDGTGIHNATSTAADIQAVLVCARTLSAAEVWSASRQMTYCDVNPDWSVWERRRRWYYGAGVGGFQAAWARNANSVHKVIGQ